MAIQYIVTREEFLSLIDQLRLTGMQERNLLSSRAGSPPTQEDIHRAFHFVVVRWIQAMGCSAVRGIEP